MPLPNPADINAAVDRTAAFSRAVINSTGKKSLTRMAKDSIFQFPCIMSASIDTDESGVIAKSIEQTYASMLVSVISLQNAIDRDKYSDTVSFLRQFHTNSLKMGRDTSSIFSVDSVIIATEGAGFNKDLLLSLWDITEEQVDMESLNDMYKPFTRTKRILNDRLEIATEANDNTDRPFNHKYKKRPENYAFQNKPEARDMYKMVKHSAKNKKLDAVGGESESRNPGGDEGLSKTINKSTYVNSQGKFQVERADKLATMEPTLITITIMNYHESAQWAQTLSLGVKAMVRLVKSSTMVASMDDAARDKAIFKFIKWTKGEYKLHDLLFGVSKYRDMAKGTTKGNWLKALKKRRAINSVSKFLGYRLLPNCTIIITEAEAEMVKESCGVDLHDSRQAKSLIDKYFLLGFAIYDTENKLYDVMYDSDEAFASYSLKALINTTNKEIVIKK